MKPRCFYSIGSLVRAVDRVSDSFETVSVDVFDTLLVRRVHDPDLVKNPVSRFIARRAAESGITVPAGKALEIRNEVEQEHRCRNGLTHPDREACYPDFMRESLDRIFGGKCPPGLFDEVAEYELAVEKAMIVPRAQFAGLLERLHGAGKRIIAITDIYMPALYVRRLLEHASLMGWIEEVFSSADTFKAKASGAAYRMIGDQYRLQPSKWLHIGDNPVSDGLRPAAMGIRAFVLKDAFEKKRRSVTCRYWRYAEKRPFWKGRCVQQLMLPIEREAMPRDRLYVTGYNFLAPLLCSFVMHVAERTRELGIRRIYFLSREGHLFRQIWESIVPVLFPEGHFAEYSYLHVSRIALACTSCAHQGLTAKNARIAFLPPRNRDFRDLCRVFNLSLDPLLPFLGRYGLNPDDPLSRFYPGHTRQMEKKLDDLISDGEFQAEVKKQTLPANRALTAYLEEQHFYDEPEAALVDIGWLGSIQRFLHESIQHHAHHPRLHGFLLAATRGIEYPTSPDNYIEGWFYDRNMFNPAGSVITYALDLFEEACRAPHPGLLRYRMREDGKHELVFRPRHDSAGLAETRQNAFFSPLQSGILDGAPRFAAAMLMLGCKPGDMRGWLNHMAVSRLAFPRSGEISAMRHRYHLDDFDGSHTPPMSLRAKSLWDLPIGLLRLGPFVRMAFYLRHLAGQILRR